MNLLASRSWRRIGLDGVWETEAGMLNLTQETRRTGSWEVSAHTEIDLPEETIGV